MTVTDITQVNFHSFPSLDRPQAALHGPLTTVIPRAKPRGGDKIGATGIALHTIPTPDGKRTTRARGNAFHNQVVSAEFDVDIPQGWPAVWDALAAYPDLTLLETWSGRIAVLAVLPGGIDDPNDFASVCTMFANCIGQIVGAEPDKSATDLYRMRVIFSDMRYRLGEGFWGQGRPDGLGSYLVANQLAYMWGVVGGDMGAIGYLVNGRSITAEFIEEEYQRGASNRAEGRNASKDALLNKSILDELDERGIAILRTDTSLRLFSKDKHTAGRSGMFAEGNRPAMLALSGLLTYPVTPTPTREAWMLSVATPIDPLGALRTAVAPEPDTPYWTHIAQLQNIWRLDDASAWALGTGIATAVRRMVGDLEEGPCLTLVGGGGLGKSKLIDELLGYDTEAPWDRLWPSHIVVSKADDLDAIQAGAHIAVFDEFNVAELGDDLIKSFITEVRSVRRKYDRDDSMLFPVPTIFTTNNPDNVIMTNGALDRRMLPIVLPFGLSRAEANAVGYELRTYCREHALDILRGAVRCTEDAVDTQDWDALLGRIQAVQSTESTQDLMDIIRAESVDGVISVTDQIRVYWAEWGFEKSSKCQQFLALNGAERFRGKDNRWYYRLPAAASDSEV